MRGSAPRSCTARADPAGPRPRAARSGDRAATPAWPIRSGHPVGTSGRDIRSGHPVGPGGRRPGPTPVPASRAGGRLPRGPPSPGLHPGSGVQQSGSTPESPAALSSRIIRSCIVNDPSGPRSSVSASPLMEISHLRSRGTPFDARFHFLGRSPSSVEAIPVVIDALVDLHRSGPDGGVGRRPRQSTSRATPRAVPVMRMLSSSVEELEGPRRPPSLLSVGLTCSWTGSEGRNSAAPAEERPTGSYRARHS